MVCPDTSQTAATTAEPEAPKEASAQLAAAESTAPTASQPETSTDTPVSGTIDQLQQLSLMDPYVAQQVNIVLFCDGYKSSRRVVGLVVPSDYFVHQALPDSEYRW